MYNDTYSRLDSLEDQNIALRKQLGEFGFFGPTYTTPRLQDIRDKIENKITVREWKLINNMNLSYTPEQIKEVASLLNRLVDDGMFNNQPAPYYCNPYYDFGGNMYPPMGTGVVADPAITNELTPKPYDGKQITICGVNGDTLAKIYPSVHLDNKTSDLVINVDEADRDTARVLYGLKVKITEAINLEQVITIWIPQEFIEFAHETFKGHKDYIDSAVIVTCPKMITILGADIKNKSAIINCVLTIFAKIFNKPIDEINNEYAGLISTDEADCEEGEESNNESD